MSSSRLASRPSTKKKKVIRPSFTQCRRSCEIPASPRRIESFVVQTDSYEPVHGEFAHKSAATAAHTITAPPPVSVLRKSRTGAARFRAHAVRPVGGAAATSLLVVLDGVGPTSRGVVGVEPELLSGATLAKQVCPSAVRDGGLVPS
jgi:hypothetical protein